MKNKISLVASMFIVASLNADDSITLKPLSVTSTVIKTDELKATQAVEVYTQKDIQQTHAQSVYDFLTKQTSVITMPSYGNPFTQLMDMRGYGTSNGNQNIVINLNGRRLNNIDTLPQLLSSISVDSISRIEIIKSSGVVFNGDGANAGVINIITKKSNDKEIALYGGSYGTFSGSFYMGHSDDRLSVSASAKTQKSDGIRYIDDASNKDKNKIATGSFDISYKVTKDLDLRAGFSFASTDVIYASYLTKSQYDADVTQKSTSYFPSTHQLYDTDTLTLGSTYLINNNLSFKIDASQDKKKSEYVSSFSTPSHYDYKSLKATLDYVSDAMSLTFGYDGFYGDKISSADKTDKNNNAVFIMSEFYFGKNSFKAGYRYEDVEYKYANGIKSLKQNNSLYGVELGYNYVLNKQNSLFVNYTRSYQAPTIDMFFATTYPAPLYTPTTSFNDFIEPMITHNYSLGYNNIGAKNKFKISAFYIKLKNEIYLHQPDFKNTNIDKSYKYGFDLYDKYLFSKKINVAFNYNYVRAMIDEEKEGGDDYSAKRLPGVSDHNIKATLNYLPNPNTTLALTQTYRSQAYASDDFNNNFSQKQDAYMSTDISVAYNKKTYEVFAKVNNLFNQKNGLWVKDDAIYPVNFTTTVLVGFKLKY